MTITNGYTTLANVKALKNVSSVDAADDGVIEAMIEQASRWIDAHTGRTFYARTETHYYDRPTGRVLSIDDDDLLTVTTLTNGDGTTIAATEYFTAPRNTSPKWMITLKESSAVSWLTDASGNKEGVISVAGTWGYCAAAPMDIRLACELLFLTLYHGRFGEVTSGVATVTGAGVVITPTAMPRDVQAILAPYKRLR